MEDNLLDSRSKRLKIGRACYTCRAKKIKCDGLRPCMQCKARNRPCTFYKDGTFDPDQQPPENQDDGSDTAKDSDNESSLLFADTKDSSSARNRRRKPFLESRTSNALASLGEGIRRITINDGSSGKTFNDAEPFGSFIKWVAEPALPSRYYGTIEMPSRKAQMRLLELYFSEYYETVPIVPKRYFFDQLRTKGPFITPLLLNAMYAQISRFAKDPDLPKAEIFFHRAKRLLDDFLDVPRVSTVVALCLMGLHESSPSTTRVDNPYCRAWMYSGMAYRMCLELGLHNDGNIAKDLSPAEIYMRQRVFWSCYCLDKLHSGGWERPWMLPRNMCRISKSSTLPYNDADEQLIADYMSHKIDICIMVEEALTIQGETDQDTYPDFVSPLQTRLNAWLQALPPALQWTPLHKLPIEDILKLPAPRPMVAHLHLVYNVCALNLLFRQLNTVENQLNRMQVAACLTTLVEFMCARPATVVWFNFLMEAVLSSIKVSVKDLYSQDAETARLAWHIFDHSVLAIHKLRQYVNIPNSAKFLQQLNGETHDNQNGENETKNDEPSSPIMLDQPTVQLHQSMHTLPFQEMQAMGSMHFEPPAYEQPISENFQDYVTLSLPSSHWSHSGSKMEPSLPPPSQPQAEPQPVTLNPSPSNIISGQHTSNFIMPNNVAVQSQPAIMTEYSHHQQPTPPIPTSQAVPQQQHGHTAFTDPQMIWHFHDE